MNKKNYYKKDCFACCPVFLHGYFSAGIGISAASAAIDKVQQQSAIKGIVVDEKGEPIIGQM